MPFPKWNINMTIQSQITLIRMIISQIHTLQTLLVKSTHQQVILQQNAQNTAIERFLHPRKTSDFLADTGRDVMFATRIVLHV